ncbi:MAG: prepilin peptidase [Burkholderiales bacterium]|nr:prepilin peptidase [Burkholderiales bacterium]
MSDAAPLFWRTVPRAAAPYAERADEADTRFDRTLLTAGAWLQRPLPRGILLARKVAALVEVEQAASDRLGSEAFAARVNELRAAFLKQGFTPELVARSFALIRTAADRTLGMRHFPVQLMGGHVMLQGMLAEMETGEGKTLTATLAAGTAALAGVPVHVITVNDYLAKRDGDGMRPLYEALGLTLGITAQEQPPEERRAAYAADITYCTNKDIGFDYLRDGLTLASTRSRGRLLLQKILGQGDRQGGLLLRGLHFAIVDEADSVLIDEARTPLVISGSDDAAGDAELYGAALEIARGLESGLDFIMNRKERQAHLTDRGRARIKDRSAALPPEWRSSRGREELAQQGLAALHLFDLDTHYLVRDGKVMIIDEYTGRVLPDRSWERGLQQLIEAKEGCDITGRRTTRARITYQRLFRRYLRLAGMTGTGAEVAPELEAVYGLKVVRIPTHRPVARKDLGVRAFVDRSQKWQDVADAVERMRASGRPVLVGTRSVGASEELALLLAARGLQHVVLNARQDAEEAAIVADAGEAGRVTVATNMAGRGTDIRPTDEVLQRGGLHVILTEFHESRRIDRQLFGRCARQGDAGSYEAIVSMDDDIFRKHVIFQVIAGFVARSHEKQRTKELRPLPAWAANFLRIAAQRAAEALQSHERRITMEADRRLDSALAFAGKSE